MSLASKIRNRIIRFQRPVINQLITQGLSYLTPPDFLILEERIKRIESKGIKGDIIEAGVALGGSAIYMAKKKSHKRMLRLYDVYGMIPEPTAEDGADVHKRFDTIKSGNSKGINGAEYYGYVDDLLSRVKENFSKFGIDCKSENIEFVKGKFEDTLIIDGPIALAHIDCDWYHSVLCCLERIHPHMSQGGEFIMDDYFHYSGCKKAVEEFLSDHPNSYQRMEKNKLHLIRL